VCGVTTEVWSNTTVREANDRGFRCIVLSDCCASYFPEFHDMGLRMIKAQGGILSEFRLRVGAGDRALRARVIDKTSRNGINLIAQFESASAHQVARLANSRGLYLRRLLTS